MHHAMSGFTYIGSIRFEICFEVRPYVMIVVPVKYGIIISETSSVSKQESVRRLICLGVREGDFRRV
jgi:hypothetical protein